MERTHVNLVVESVFSGLTHVLPAVNFTQGVT